MAVGNVEDAFDDRLVARAATFDELLSDDFESLPGQKDDAEMATQRLARWCQSCASGDWSLFDRRLERDGLALHRVVARFRGARHKAGVGPPAWAQDARWIETILSGGDEVLRYRDGLQEPSRNAFEHLFVPLADEAAARLWASVGRTRRARLTSSARDCLRQLLLADLCRLCAPVLYERFDMARPAVAAEPGGPVESTWYDQFVLDMKSGGLRRLFDEKPVLLRLIASMTQQWLATSREFVVRIDADVRAIHRDILHTEADSPVVRVVAGLSDPHRGGQQVLRVEFEDGEKVMYKPKDLRVDVAWHRMVERLNTEAPIALRSVRALARAGYGWTEFIDHTGCVDAQGLRRYFRRAGAWLALFHCFVATDIHHENLIAAGDHPVPIDLETILQAATEAGNNHATDASALDAAKQSLANSVLAIGLLPAYRRTPDDNVHTVGGVAAEWTARTKLAWSDINSDKMRPVVASETGTPPSNLPHHSGRYATPANHREHLIAGFEQYARFLLSYTRGVEQGGLFDGFAGLPVRKVIRPTQFYAMLLNRLRDDRTMTDGVTWSAQADFLARLADWDVEGDPMWHLQRGERSALVELNVPLFMMSSDGGTICDATGATAETRAEPGLQRARDRVRGLDEREIAWQTELIRQTSNDTPRAGNVMPTAGALVPCVSRNPPTLDVFLAQADTIAEEIQSCAIRRGTSAAWIGYSWFPQGDELQLAALGPDLYNGACGIALFLAAYAMVIRQPTWAEFARAAVSPLRADLTSRNAAHVARLLGVGGASGLGSITYALTTMSRMLADDDLLVDAHRAATLITDDMIAADRKLDVIGGSAGTILCLLRLYEETRERDALDRAVKCGLHLLAQPRSGPPGRRSWHRLPTAARPLIGMSHGAAGFAYAMCALAAATGRDEFAEAGGECIEFERCAYDVERADLAAPEPHWRSQWCHGAVGIGLARLGMTKRGATGCDAVAGDICTALAGADRSWPGHVDTLCCGALGNVELVREAGRVLNRSDLCELSTRRLSSVLQTSASTGDFRWKGGARRFNIGLFCGLAGVGYTCLREIDSSLPNVLIWE